MSGPNAVNFDIGSDTICGDDRRLTCRTPDNRERMSRCPARGACMRLAEKRGAIFEIWGVQF